MAPRFEDYHRTIVGYHGTKRSIALEIVQGKRQFNVSRNDDDWLGHGVYFWEHAPQQAWWWAKRRSKRQNWHEPIAVLGSMIRLGFCLDMLDPFNVIYLEQLFEQYREVEAGAGRQLPKNVRSHKRLDCAVFQYAFAAVEAIDNQQVDSTRAVYVPTGAHERVWPKSWIARQAHIQICVRNQQSILGTWLVSPISSEEWTDDSKSHEQGDVDIRDDEEGRRQAETDADE